MFAKWNQMIEALAKVNKDGSAHSLFHNAKVPYITHGTGDKESFATYRWHAIVC